MKRKKKPKIFKGKRGEYIKEWYFVNGKQKYRRVYVVEGIPAGEYYERNAALVNLWRDEKYELLIERTEEEERQNDFATPN